MEKSVHYTQVNTVFLSSYFCRRSFFNIPSLLCAFEHGMKFAHYEMVLSLLVLMIYNMYINGAYYTYLGFQHT